MSLKIYGRKSSCNVQKVLWLCDELNINYEQVDYGGIHGGTKEEKFTSLNPNRTVPVINDDNFILYESNAIIDYLAQKNNSYELNNIKEKALSRQWIDWASFTLAAPCATVTLNTILLPKEKRDPGKIDKAKSQVLNLLKVLDAQLIENEYILGDNFTITDIPAGCWVNRCEKLKIDFSIYNNIKLWFEKIKSRKSFIKSISKAPLPPN